MHGDAPRTKATSAAPISIRMYVYTDVICYIISICYPTTIHMLYHMYVDMLVTIDCDLAWPGGVRAAPLQSYIILLCYIILLFINLYIYIYIYIHVYVYIYI